ncbi:eukaryotic translation initiation factor 2B delta subunit [Flagelloscypha sp. PMI_526]|nr:eukaryotic translation initiation factor 2B delta subunit [Flagelloscypha sp. PMI_526]
MSTVMTEPPKASTQPGRAPGLVQPPQTPRTPKAQTTKAERRAQQEAQRAAKAAAKDQGGNVPAQKSKGNATPRNKTTFDKQNPNSKDPPSGPSKSSSAAPTVSSADKSTASQSRNLRIFSHFADPNIPASVPEKNKGVIHPAVTQLALQFSRFRICGANARCIATLSAFKTVIQDYSTPSNTTLSRHLMTHLSPQITHLVSARPMSVTMGNAIRQLKLDISGSDIDLPEQDAKDALCQKIDDYIRDRIIMADEVIQESATSKIKDGDVILTYARSSVIEKVLLSAHKSGKRFSVIVIDSRPLLEGKVLLKRLTSTTPPIPCTYALLPALPSVINEATTVLLGAHSLHSNGAVYSRAGTAMVAMMAKQNSVPVMVCCETYKFSDTVMLDGFGKNELAPSKFSDFPVEAKSNLQVLNPLYDLTPPSTITVVVTEVGLIPPTSISSIPLALGKTNL